MLEKKKNSLKILFNLSHKKNLVVILDESLSADPLNELATTKIPTISLNYSSICLNSYNFTYKIKQNLHANKNKSITDLFFSILVTVLKRAEKTRIKTIKNEKIKITRRKIKLERKFYKFRHKNKKLELNKQKNKQ